MSGALDQLDRLTAGFAATVVEESRSIQNAARAVTGALEGALFAGCVVGAMIFAERASGRRFLSA